MTTLGINTASPLTRLKRTLQAAFGLIVKSAIFITIALIGGALSSWYAVESGTRFNTERIGPWTKWSNAGRPDADPYSKVRFGNRNELVFSSVLAARYEASRDSEGRSLHSSCDYVLEGLRVPDAWWSLAVFDTAGRLIQNEARRYGYNAATVMRETSGAFVINLSRDAKPYNWLPTSRAGRMVIVLEVQQSTGTASLQTDQDSTVLPAIRRTACR
ncbi:MAG: DUF1214 domain-containing protein [Hyphomicrobiaceae bacterium]|nr:DUF1214 domain-containing protein [Hyphomicrobiaceae bacterium]